MPSRLLSIFLKKAATVAVQLPELLSLATLTERELALLCQLVHDPSDQQAAEIMCTSTKTIENYKNRIGDKLGLKGRRAVTKFAIQHRTILEDLPNQAPTTPAMKIASAKTMTDTKAGSDDTTKPLKNWGANPQNIEGITPQFFSIIPPNFVMSWRGL
jgi:DNA-binding CsgD family transcriptional regulator